MLTKGWHSLEGCDELGRVAGEPGQQASVGTISAKAEPGSEQEKSLVSLLQSLPALFFIMLFISCRSLFVPFL